MSMSMNPLCTMYIWRARKRKKGGRKISKGRTPENIHIICHYVYTRIQEGAYKVLPTNFPCSVKILWLLVMYSCMSYLDGKNTLREPGLTDIRCKTCRRIRGWSCRRRWAPAPGTRDTFCCVRGPWAGGETWEVALPSFSWWPCRAGSSAVVCMVERSL